MDERVCGFEAYLQWKADSWRDTAIQLYAAIILNNPVEISKAMKNFEEVRSQFPYVYG